MFFILFWGTKLQNQKQSRPEWNGLVDYQTLSFFRLLAVAEATDNDKFTAFFNKRHTLLLSYRNNRRLQSLFN